MEPPRGVWASLWNLIRFLPYFIGLLILGLIKGVIMFPVIFLIMTAGISSIILGLWPLHCFYTYYCILSTKQFGPALKLILCICIPVILVSWLPVALAAGVLGGAAYGLLAPIFATFQAVEEGKPDKLYHCIFDGIWSSIEGSFTVIRDVLDFFYHSYLSIMNELRNQEGKYYEIRMLPEELFYVPLALLAGVLGFLVDFPVISIIALCKSPYMLVKGWHRLLHDCIGREGPFLDTICVPFAGLAILLWPLAVVGAVLGSMASSIFLGAYAAVIVYQERSFWFGLCYIVASLSIYDEYSNDILDMPEGSCIPRPQYRKNQTAAHSTSFSRLNSSVKDPPTRMNSMNGPMLELKPLEFADVLLKECQRHGEAMAAEGIITVKDIEDAKKSKEIGRVICIGLPAYCLFQALLRSAKADVAGILLEDDGTEITPSNRPKDVFFDWFLNPLLIIKDQIKADNLSEAEEDYLGKLVLLSADAERLKSADIGPVPEIESELRRAEFDALARRLHGIIKSIARYPTIRRRFDSIINNMLEDLAKKNGDSRKGLQPMSKSKSMFVRIFSQKSFKGRQNDQDPDQEMQVPIERDV